MARINPLRQSNYTCHDCYAKVGIHPFRWPMGDGLWIPLCAGCHYERFRAVRAVDLEIDQGNAVACACEIVRLHGWQLDNPISIIRERRKAGGAQ